MALTQEQTSQIKKRYIHLVSQIPIKDMEVEDANLLTILAKDPDTDIIDAIDAASVTKHGRKADASRVPPKKLLRSVE